MTDFASTGPSRRAVLGGFVAASSLVLGLGKARAQSNMLQTGFGPETAYRPTPSGAGKPRPRFAPKLEEFPVQLPPGKQLGRTVAVSIAPNGDVFILQNSITGHSIPPPEARLGRVVRFSSNGRYITSWGGPDSLPKVDGISQWPEGYDGLDVDADGNVWIGGYAKDDDAMIKFSPDGRFLQRLGERGRGGTDASRTLLNGPVSVYNDVKNREVFVADGYGNHRIIAFNSDTGKFTRMWGAYGLDPATIDPDVGFGATVHKIALGPNGLIYVCDRLKCRVQEFEVTPTSVRYLREVYIAQGTVVQGSCFDVAFTDDKKFMLVADGMNGRVWSVDLAKFEVLGWHNVEQPDGDLNIPVMFSELHRFARRANGDLLLAHVRPGVQVLKYLGVS